MFAKRLKALRKSNGLTQVQFAQMFHVANGTIAMWETGKREPDSSTLKRLADYFGVSVDYLVGHEMSAEKHGASNDGLSVFPTALRKLVEDSGKNPIKIANDLGISQEKLNDCLTGSVKPDKLMLDAFSSYFDVTIDFLLGSSNIKPITVSGQPQSVLSTEAGAVHSNDGLSSVAKEFMVFFDQLDADRQSKLLELARLYLSDQRKKEENL